MDTTKITAGVVGAVLLAGSGAVAFNNLTPKVVLNASYAEDEPTSLLPTKLVPTDCNTMWRNDIYDSVTTTYDVLGSSTGTIYGNVIGFTAQARCSDGKGNDYVIPLTNQQYLEHSRPHSQAIRFNLSQSVSSELLDNALPDNIDQL